MMKHLLLIMIFIIWVIGSKRNKKEKDSKDLITIRKMVFDNFEETTFMYGIDIASFNYKLIEEFYWFIKTL
jgi:hypothetical protein